MKKKLMAMVTAAMCVSACIPAMPVQAETIYTRYFNVIGIDYADGTDTPESYLVRDESGRYKAALSAEEMAQYLTEDSAQPEMGSTLEIKCSGIIGGYLNTIHLTEDDWIRTAGSMEEKLPLREEYVVIKKSADLGVCTWFVLKNPETGDRYFYTEEEYADYTFPYSMADAEVGDTVTFIMRQYVDVDGTAYEPENYLPLEVKKGDGTIPEMPEGEITREYGPRTGTIIAASYTYGCNVPTNYLIDLEGTGAAYLGADTVFRYCDTDKAPGCGDILEIDISSIAETYPCQLNIPQNAKISYLGNAVDLYGTAEYTVTGNSDYQLKLEDAEGNAASYSYYLASFGHNLYHSNAFDAQAGDKLTFMLNKKGNPMIPITEMLHATPTQEYAVVAVDHAEEPQNYVLMETEYPYDTIRLTAPMVERCLAEGEPTLQFGDLLELTGHVMEYDGPFIYTHDFALQKTGENLGTTFSDGIIRRIGSVYDDCTEVEMEYVRTGERNLHICQLKDMDGNYKMLHQFDYLTEYVQPGCANLENLYTGDKISMIVYKDVPIIPGTTSTILGDADASGKLDILDILAVNQHLLAGKPLPESTQARTTSASRCDMDGDGKVTSSDALAMLKRSIGVE